MTSRYLYMTVAIILVLLGMPFIRQAGAFGWLCASLMIALIPLASLFAFAHEKRYTTAILLLSTPFLALDVAALFAPRLLLFGLTYGFGALLYAFIVSILLKDLLVQRVITADMIFCAISIYLLIGFMWGGIYGVIETVDPGAFTGLDRTADILYFSFVALTTVGFGDIAPVSVLARRLAVLEAAMGSIYMAIIVALIVGRYLSRETVVNEGRPTTSGDARENGARKVRLR